MTYDDAIAFWFGRINYEVRSAAPSDLKLERMRALRSARLQPDVNSVGFREISQ